MLTIISICTREMVVLFYCDSSSCVWRHNLFVFRNDWAAPVHSREIGSDGMIGIKNPFKKNVLYRNIRFTTLKRKVLKFLSIHHSPARANWCPCLGSGRLSRMATPQKVASVLWFADIKSLWRLFGVVSGVNTDINLQHARAPHFGTAVRINFERFPL